MIGVVRKDAGGAPQLFGQHRAGEEVGPGGSSEGEKEVGTSSLFVIKAVRASNHEARFAPSVVPPASESVGEVQRAEHVPFLVEQDRDTVVDGGRQPAAAFR